jgi:hypothetical protein
MLISHKQNSGKDHNIRITNKSIKNLAEFKYLKIDTNKSQFHGL